MSLECQGKFILHQTGVIREAVQALHDYATRKTRELRQADKALKGLQGLNHRQQALLAHTLREPDSRYIIEGHRRSHGITFPTARNDLIDLVGRGLRVVTKEGRFNVFRSVSDLSEKLGRVGEGGKVDLTAEETLPLKLPFPSRHE